MANLVRPRLEDPRISAAPAVRRREWEPTCKSHRGQRQKAHRKSGWRRRVRLFPNSLVWRRLPCSIGCARWRRSSRADCGRGPPDQL